MSVGTPMVQSTQVPTSRKDMEKVDDNGINI
jgi:hypothetical protein